MAGYLMRDAAPLSESEWTRLDELVAEVAKRQLVGRRVLPIYGPLGPAAPAIPVDTYGGVGPDKGEEAVRREGRTYVVPRELHKDFVINWRDIEVGRAGKMSLEFSAGAAATAMVAQAEDTLIFRGDENNDGIMTAKGTLACPMGDWAANGAFADVTAAIQKLQEAGLPGRYALVVSPAGYAQMQRPYENSGVLEISLVRELCADGVYQTAVLNSGEAVIMSTGPHNLDLAVGVDLSVAYLDNVDMDHRFRVFESVALRIKRPEAVCTITK